MGNKMRFAANESDVWIHFVAARGALNLGISKPEMGKSPINGKGNASPTFFGADWE